MTPKYHKGQRVWLTEFDNGDEVIPRQQATILNADVESWGISYVVLVEPESPGDDGLRELTEDQIEGDVQDAR